MYADRQKERFFQPGVESVESRHDCQLSLKSACPSTRRNNQISNW